MATKEDSDAFANADVSNEHAAVNSSVAASAEDKSVTEDGTVNSPAATSPDDETSDKSDDSSDDAPSDYEFDMYDDTDDDESVNSPVAGPSGTSNVSPAKKAKLSEMKPGSHPTTKPAAGPDNGASDTTDRGDEGATNKCGTISFENGEKASPLCATRIQRDIKELFSEAPPGVHIAPLEHNVAKMHALVLGPADTPYEGGFFHFFVEFPVQYPVMPPSVQIMNTDGGRVTFHPYLHASGVVCLSLLRASGKASWTPAHSLMSVLLSIQAMLSDRSCLSELLSLPGDYDGYRHIVQHETIRVAVCDAIEACLDGSSLCPPLLREVMLKTFVAYYDRYLRAVMAAMGPNRPRPKLDLCGLPKSTIYFVLHRRLQNLKRRVEESLKATDKGKE
ncbi:hypothetical protein HPB50_004867 [Hyalomma asiaticum]|uniref:Uncharacterized protein n=1 Tax=Hyalomma asiaticum TaxID=266040 RepID=A0ACB7SEZ4_HYAAI|nr:hypothetical protein HPB50_004867 [Hyalomma asiaticum]